MKIVLDTNVLISAIAFGGKPKKILQKVIEGKIVLVISEELLAELTGVLSGKTFKYPIEVLRAIENELRSLGLLVEPDFTLNVVKRDPDDNRVLECAVEGKVDIIVSGDLDLLDLQEYKGIPIVSPAQFLEKSG